MKNLVRGALVLAVGIVLLGIPRAAAAHYTGFPHRHVYGPRAPLVPGMRTFNIDRPGVYLGGALVGNIMLNQSDSPGGNDFISHGGGGSLFLGIRIAPMFALEFGYAQTAHNPVETAYGDLVGYLALHALTADAKLIFPNASNVRPYIQAGVGYYILARDNASDAVSGGGLQVGGGVDIWLNPWWSLGGRVLYHGMKFSSLDTVDGRAKPFLSTASIDLNAQIHF